ncbi:phosphatidylserine decarboxylase-domain-containing protein [Flammula alnicola]|nr:phosphatidylserine decarboxylase-domain-containing protein [Flammula alnicola]
MSSETPPTTKGTKIKRVLKSAARLPRVPYVKAGRGSGRNNFTPRPGEPPVVVLKLRVLGCTNVLAKDRAGTSDPFVVISLLNIRQQTPVAKRTLNPIYAAKDATFDFPIYLSLADKLGVIELVVWDKDMLRKEYLGEVAFPLEDWFTDRIDGKERDFGFDQPGNTPISLDIVSTRAGTPTTGSMQIKLGFARTANSQNLMEFDEIYSELVKRSRPSLVSAPPTEGVGTIRSNQIGGAHYQDDGGLSSDPDDSDDEAEFVDASLHTTLFRPLPPPSSADTDRTQPVVGQAPPQPRPPFNLPELKILPSSPATPTPGNLPTAMPTEDTPRASASFSVPTPQSSRFPKKIRPQVLGVDQLDGGTFVARAARGNLVPPNVQSAAEKRSASRDRKKFGRSWSTGTVSPSGSSGSETGTVGISSLGAGRRRKSDFEFKGANDIVGIVMLEIQGADDLPRLANMTRTGWDMDPFVVISFGKKVFRTRVIRHSRNPVWDEKLLFHVRRYETSFKTQLTVLDWDKLSSNDHIGDVYFDVKELMENAPQPDPVTGLYAHGEEQGGGEEGMREFKLPLSTAKEMPWEAKHNPVIRFRAKYQPYDALRQRFWRQYLKQYDTDDTGRLSHLELTSMLDSLGSTLTRSTVSTFFTRYGKKAHEDEITVEQAVQCLETELGRPDSEKKRVDADDGLPDTSLSATPVLMVAGQKGEELQLQLDQLNFSGPPHVSAIDGGDSHPGPHPYTTEPVQLPLVVDSSFGAGPENPDSSSDDADGDLSNSSTPVSTAAESLAASSSPPGTPGGKKTKKMRFQRIKRQKKSAKETSEDSTTSASESNPIERIINVKNCPLCHRPRLNSKAEMDIVTHLAICASQDWNQVDKIVVGNFVTASQAQRKWYTKIITKVSSGDYRLGANSANIIVQSRITGQLQEEKMQVYVRLGIRLLYKGATSRMEGARARRLLKSLSIKQGSAKEIPTFVEFHGLNVDEILDPLDSFKTFNEFFYRKLKPSARPVESPNDPYRLVSAADCRLMTFETVSEATRLWIKGREFTVARLLGDAYKGQADKYTGGALAIFRLAPQDYHRFHSPVEGTIGPMTYISGEYYTVNPQAIRSSLDVYGENARKIVPIDSPQFGRVMAVCVGAMMVGSIKTTVQEGEYVQRGQELGYFAFGGSTVVILFEKGKVAWDEDLLINGRASLETLVRVGMGLGRGRPADA